VSLSWPFSLLFCKAALAFTQDGHLRRASALSAKCFGEEKNGLSKDFDDSTSGGLAHAAGQIRAEAAEKRDGL
jgi:hypothetical protein